MATACQYLFRRDADALFPALDSAFVNQSLETLMKVIDHLVAKNPEAMFVFDPTAFNNQCHLYALMTTETITQVKTLRAALDVFSLTPVGQTIQGYYVDERFLYLSFFLSYAFLTDPKLLEKLTCKVLQTMKEPEPTKAFRVFLKDPGSLSSRIHASRLALNLLFAEHMKTVLSGELAAVANSNLQYKSDGGTGTLYTLPKIVGVAYMIDAMAKERIALHFKVKAITQEGTATFSCSPQNLAELEPSTPVVVFEMVVAGDSLNYTQCRDIAKRCPSHSRRNPSSRDRHKPSESCRFCTDKRVDVTPYLHKFERILAQSDKMFLALGADFVREKQSSFLPFFTDREKFPLLTALFEASVPNIQKMFLSMNASGNISVSHVYTDSAARASESALLIDDSYETHLTKRKLI